MKHKNEVTAIFIAFIPIITNLLNRKIKILRTDGGTEYTNHQFINLLNTNGITHQMSCPYTPQQNGVAER
ncbi:DDE-type integrase/transposase/recombinase, partial [Streptococcus anginosus]|uniref:DDE-type integrase/transposase/recombinase n=1 Tax=Streptococcus anginosus TaxID=1328 RepID=UPI002EDA7A51